LTVLPLHLDDDGPLRILCLGAHCDDIEIGCGGTLTALTRADRETHVTWVVMSSTPEREDETREAARSLVADDASISLQVHRFRDGFLPTVAAEVKEVFEGLKELRPDVVFTHFGADAHQDHRLVSELTWNTFRDHLVLEYEIPKYDGDLGRPNLYVPLDEGSVTHKVDTLMSAFPSQRSRPWFDADTFRALMRLRGLECNAEGRYAEAFHVRKLVLR
jgi:LmbE family N-acetylglucosaminyl deacetylase